MITTKGIPKTGDFVIELYYGIVFRFLVKNVTKKEIHTYFCIETEGADIRLVHDRIYSMMLYDQNSKILRPNKIITK